jgi:hypothetical protein
MSRRLHCFICSFGLGAPQSVGIGRQKWQNEGATVPGDRERFDRETDFDEKQRKTFGLLTF